MLSKISLRLCPQVGSSGSLLYSINSANRTSQRLLRRSLSQKNVIRWPRNPPESQKIKIQLKNQKGRSNFRKEYDHASLLSNKRADSRTRPARHKYEASVNDQGQLRGYIDDEEYDDGDDIDDDDDDGEYAEEVIMETDLEDHEMEDSEHVQHFKEDDVGFSGTFVIGGEKKLETVSHKVGKRDNDQTVNSVSESVHDSATTLEEIDCNLSGRWRRDSQSAEIEDSDESERDPVGVSEELKKVHGMKLSGGSSEQILKKQRKNTERLQIHPKNEILYGISPSLLALQQSRRSVSRAFVSSAFMKSPRAEANEILQILKEREVSLNKMSRGQLNKLANGRPHQNEILYGISPSLLALQQSRWAVSRAFVSGAFMKSVRAEANEILQILEEREVSLNEMSRGHLNKLANGRPHQGICLEVSPLQFESLSKISGDLITVADDSRKCILALDQILDPMNLGAVMRSAYFLGVDWVITSKNQCCPLTSTVSKASSGVAEVMSVYAAPNMEQLLQGLRSHGWQILGATNRDGPRGTSDSLPVLSCREVRVTQPTVLVIGSEGFGLRSSLQSCCDTLVTISAGRTLHRHIDSLNVSVATGILLHSLLANR